MAIDISKFSRPDMHDDIASVLVNEATIAARVHELGAALSPSADRRRDNCR